MALREIPVVNCISRSVLQRLKKEGIYSIKYTKVTSRDIENSIRHDEDLIRELSSGLDSDRLKQLEELEQRYLEVKDTDEWTVLCDAFEKLTEYARLCRIWIKDDSYNVEAYDEIINAIDQSFALKYRNVISDSSYAEFYKELQNARLSRDAYCVAIISDVKKSIEELKEYCMKHPEEIKGYKKGR